MDPALVSSAPVPGTVSQNVLLLFSPAELGPDAGNGFLSFGLCRVRVFHMVRTQIVSHVPFSPISDCVVSVGCAKTRVRLSISRPSEVNRRPSHCWAATQKNCRQPKYSDCDLSLVRGYWWFQLSKLITTATTQRETSHQIETFI